MVATRSMLNLGQSSIGDVMLEPEKCTRQTRPVATTNAPVATTSKRPARGIKKAPRGRGRARGGRATQAAAAAAQAPNPAVPSASTTNATACPKCPLLKRTMNNLATENMTDRKKLQALRRFNRRLTAKLEAATRSLEAANAVIVSLGGEVVELEDPEEVDLTEGEEEEVEGEYDGED